MKILVIGGAGYIGSSLVPRLVERGYDVHVVDLLWFGNSLPKDISVERRDASTLGESDLKGFDQVIFLAGLSNDPMAEYSPARNFHENGAIPAYLSWIAKKVGVKRFIYGGTCSVYGYTLNELFDETQPAQSSYPYGISKLVGEYGCLQQNGNGFSVVCFRQGTVSGYSPRMRFDLIVDTMFKSAIVNGRIRVNNPAIWRPILSVKDAATAYIRAVESPDEVSGIFNIASGNFTVGEVADIVNDGLYKNFNKRADLEVLNVKDFRNYKVSTKKAADVLSFKPQFSIGDIIDELATKLEEFGDFSASNYYNIETFKTFDAGVQGNDSTAGETARLRTVA